MLDIAVQDDTNHRNGDSHHVVKELVATATRGEHEVAANEDEARLSVADHLEGDCACAANEPEGAPVDTECKEAGDEHEAHRFRIPAAVHRSSEIVESLRTARRNSCVSMCISLMLVNDNLMGRQCIPRRK